MATLASLSVDLDMNEYGFVRSSKRAAKWFKKMTASIVKNSGKSRSALGGLARDVNAIDTLMTTMARTARNMTLTHAFLGIAGAAITATRALAVLPALAVSVTAAFQTVKIATAGMGAALSAAASGDVKAMNEALKELAPSAQSFVRSFRRIAEAFKPIQQAVQQQFFLGLGAEMEQVAKEIFPILNTGLTRIASKFNTLFHEAANAAQTPWFTGRVSSVLNTTAKAMGNLAGATKPLMRAIAALIGVGEPYIAQLSKWIKTQAKAAAKTLSTEKGMRKLAASVQQGVEALKTLLSIVGNVGGILVGLFQAMEAGASDFLGRIEEMTADIERWIKSAKGQRTLIPIFDTLADFASAVADALKLVLQIAGWLTRQFNKMWEPLQQVVLQFAAWSIVGGLIAGKLFKMRNASGLLVAIVFQLTSGLWELLKKLRLLPGFLKRVAVRLTMWGILLADTGRKSKATAGKIKSSFKKMATTAAAKGKVAIMWLGRVAFAWVAAAARAMASAIVMAAAWFVALGPIGWVIAGILLVIGIFALLWWKCEAFRKFWKGLWKDIQNIAGAVADWFAGPFKNAFVNAAKAIANFFTGPFVGAFQDAWNAIERGWNTFKSFFTHTIPNAVHDAWRAVKGFVGDFFQAGVDLLMGLVNGVKSAVGRLISAARGAVSDAIQAARNLLGIGSPSKVFISFGQALMEGLAIGIRSRERMVQQAVQAALSRTTLTPMQRAAREILRHIRSGGSMFEDFSFRGSSDLIGQMNDQLARAFYRANPNFDFGPPGSLARVERYLAGVVNQPNQPDFAAALSDMNVVVYTSVNVDSKTLARAVEQGQIKLEARR